MAGSEADVVHYSLETDVTRLVGEGLVAEDWKDNATKGIATSSVVVFVVRPGNPEGIEGWDDLVEPGVEIITPNPGSSGSARWNILAAWAHATGGTDDEAAGKEFLTKLLEQHDRAAGLGPRGDDRVHRRQRRRPPLLRERGDPGQAERRGHRLRPPRRHAADREPGRGHHRRRSDAAKSFLEFLTGPEAQADYAAFGFRPVVDGVDIAEVEGANDPATRSRRPGTLYTIDENFGGWGEAADKYFGDGEEGNPLGIITALQQELGKEGEE